MTIAELLLAGAGVTGVGVGLSYWGIRRRHLDRWLLPYVLQTHKRRALSPGKPVHCLLCVADHFEPKTKNASPAVARARMDRWVKNYPRLFEQFRDSDG